MLPYNTSLKNVSRRLRKSETKAERLLWSKLRRKQLKGLQFYRQKTIENYVVYFFCPGARMVIELDGGQHFSAGGKEKDTVRDRQLQGLGLRVIRFSDAEVMKEITAVVARIFDSL